MIDQWLKKGLQKIFDGHGVGVFIDETGDAEFLLNCLSQGYAVLRANSEIEGLYVKYQIEKTRSPE